MAFCFILCPYWFIFGTLHFLQVEFCCCHYFSILKQVPPEALHPQPQKNDNDGANIAQQIEETHTEPEKSGGTYRTEIVGNVVMKKKIKENRVSV